MSLYTNYMQLRKKDKIQAGFSTRLPDYAIRFWLDSLEQALSRCSKGCFLDIGAGDGRLSNLLLHTYSPCGMAVEIQVNKKSWDPILKKFPNFCLKEGLLQDISHTLKNQTPFTLVILAEVFEHIPPTEVSHFLSQLYNIMAPDGKIFLTTPNKIVQGPAELSHIWHEKQPYGHFKHYTLKELETVFSQAGFIMEWHGYECHNIKKMLYNKVFYPISRLDGRLLNSHKIPLLLRYFYYFISLPFLLLLKGFFWFIAKVIYFIEKRFSNEQTAGTIMVLFKKN